MNKISFWIHLFNFTRIKTLLWHTLGQVIGFLLADLTTAISNHTIVVPAWTAIGVGLIIAQVTKAVNNYISLKEQQ